MIGEGTTRRTAIGSLFAAPAVLTASEPPSPKLISQDVILQRELRAYMMAHNAVNEMALSLRRRARAGATVESGPFEFKSGTSEDIAEYESDEVTGIGAAGCEVLLKA